MEKLMMWTLAAVIALAAGPTLAGYAWAVGLLPVYGAVCHADKVFGSHISPDGYRVFLLRRGCDVDAAIREIVAAATAEMGLSVDPEKIVAIYRGTERADEGDESLATDIVQASLRDFVLSIPGKTDCAPGGNCTNAGQPPDPIAGLPGAYPTFARAHFLDALDDGADYISWLLRLGPLVQALLCLVYLIAIALAGRLAVNAIRRHKRLPPKR